jgi:hypothetical protein
MALRAWMNAVAHGQRVGTQRVRVPDRLTTGRAWRGGGSGGSGGSVRRCRRCRVRPGREKRVISQDFRVPVGGALFQFAVHLADRRVDVDHQPAAPRPAPSDRPRPADGLGDHRVELSGVPETERPQGRAEGGGGNHPMPEDLVGGPDRRTSAWSIRRPPLHARSSVPSGRERTRRAGPSGPSGRSGPRGRAGRPGWPPKSVRRWPPHWGSSKTTGATPVELSLLI